MFPTTVKPANYDRKLGEYFDLNNLRQFNFGLPSVDVPPISNPMTGKPSETFPCKVRAYPTTPPASIHPTE